MVKRVEIKVMCPHSFCGHANTVSVLYIEENGEIKISGSNGRDNLNGSVVCQNCIKTISEDFETGKLKDLYIFSQ